MSLDQFTVRLATETDITFVMSLQRRNRESVGGLPTPAIAERITRRTLLLGELNGEPAGYLLYDYRDNILRIPQACIQYDARRRYYGEQLVGQMLNLYPNAAEIRLRCAADLDANVFWQALGFVCVSTVKGGTRRGRLLNNWQKWNDAHLFTPATLAVAPAWQGREDCKDAETGFLASPPDGFIDCGQLGKLAWSNRKTTPVPADTNTEHKD
jgi:hypothetical protein